MTKSARARTIENAVLDVYRKVSPSYREMYTKEHFKNNYLQRINILHELSLPEQSFKNKSVIDIGGGTGENSIFYALWGAKVTILEPNEISCKRASKLFRQYGKMLSVINKSLFDIGAYILKPYDIVICEGVLQHTYDPMSALGLIAGGMNRGAILMIAIAGYHGWFKRSL